MPSYLLNQFADLEEMMCKHFFNLDLREPNGLLPSLNLAMTASGSAGEPRRNASSSLSCLPSDPSDSVFLTSSRWEQQSQSPQLGRSTQWVKSDFPFQRSVSMVETGSASGASLGWLGADMGDMGQAALNSSSSWSVSSTSSSSRYKTELCRSFTESGSCKYGGKCQFAHGPEELRDLNRHPKYKTELCRTFHTIGFCPYGMRCHFVHNGEEESKLSLSRSSSSSSSSIPHQPVSSSSSSSSRPHRPPLIRQSFSFSGFPSAPQLALTGPAALAHAPVARAPSASPPSCADVTDLLSHVFLEMDSGFEASPTYQHLPPSVGQAVAAAAAADPRSPFLPSPDSGFSPCALSPTSSPSLRRSPIAAVVPSEPLGARSLSCTSLSDPDQDRSSSTSSLSGSDSCGGPGDGSGKRLAVFSQLSVPEDAAGFYL